MAMQDCSMAQFKPQLADALIACLSPIREKYKELQENPDYVYDLMRQGAEQTREEAEHRMELIKTIMGLVVLIVCLDKRIGYEEGLKLWMGRGS